MYKVFSLIYFTCIILTISFLMANIDGDKLGRFFAVVILTSIFFVAYFVYDHWLKTKKLFLNLKLTKYLTDKIYLKFKFLPLPLITSSFFLFYITLILTSVFYASIISFYPIFHNQFSKLYQKTPTKLDSELDSIKANLSELSESQKNIESNLFYLQNEVVFEDEDLEYKYRFEVRKAELVDDHFVVSYDLGLINKNYNTDYWQFIESYSPRSDSLEITGNINSVEIKTFNLKLMNGIPGFILKVADDKKDHYRIFYIDYPADPSAVYNYLNPFTEIKYPYEEQIVSITPDFNSSSVNVQYRSKGTLYANTMIISFYTKDGMDYTVDFPKN